MTELRAGGSALTATRAEPGAYAPIAPEQFTWLAPAKLAPEQIRALDALVEPPAGLSLRAVVALVAALLVAALLAAQLLFPAAAPPLRIVSVSGAQLLRAGQIRPAHVGDQLQAGDTLTTLAGGSVRASAGARVLLLAPLTSATLGGNGELAVLHGTLGLQSGGQSWRLSAPNAQLTLDPGTALRFTEFPGSAPVTVWSGRASLPAAQGLPMLYQHALVASSLITSSPATLTHDELERALAPELDDADSTLMRAGATVGATSLGQQVVSRLASSLGAPAPSGPLGEQALTLGVALDAPAVWGSPIARVERVASLRARGGSWGVVAALAQVDASRVERQLTLAFGPAPLPSSPARAPSAAPAPAPRPSSSSTSAPTAAPTSAPAPRPSPSASALPSLLPSGLPSAVPTLPPLPSGVPTLPPLPSAVPTLPTLPSPLPTLPPLRSVATTLVGTVVGALPSSLAPAPSSLASLPPAVASAAAPVKPVVAPMLAPVDSAPAPVQAVTAPVAGLLVTSIARPAPSLLP